MDISKWDIERVMQLPDWCFGWRFPVCTAIESSTGALTWDISEVSLPERAVLWELVFYSPRGYTTMDSIRIGLAHQIPTSQAQMDKSTELLKGFGRLISGRRILKLYGAEVPSMRMLRMPVETGNRKLVLEVKATTGNNSQVILMTVWSSLPKEVPDWLFSARAGMLL